MIEERIQRARGVLVIAAHPDDEAIGFSAGLAMSPAATTIVHVTDGAPRDPVFARAAGFSSREDYARARRAEALAAAAIAGVEPERCLTLDAVDQEAACHLAALSRAAARILAARAPEIVVTHPYEGGHPDHDACAFIARAAVDSMRPAPMLIELASYHLRGGQVRWLEFLTVPGEERLVEIIALDEAARRRKQAMFAAYRSQAAILAAAPIGAEPVRLAPRYDFTHPPQVGELGYERFAAGMSRDRFVALARAALASLSAPAPGWRDRGASSGRSRGRCER